jgi:hypothetical protein
LASRNNDDLRSSIFDLALHSSAVIRLQTIFRQAAGSFIITNAHRINHGNMPVIDNDMRPTFSSFERMSRNAARSCALNW